MRPGDLKRELIRGPIDQEAPGAAGRARRQWLNFLETSGTIGHGTVCTQWPQTIERSQIFDTYSSYVNDKPLSLAITKDVKFLKRWPRNTARWLSS
jgi:hypothetical protein